MKDTAQLEKKIKVKFKNKDLLTQAVVHRSYLNEHPELRLEQNERLEFLGDAILEMVVTEYLYRNYPNPEGELTNWRASLVNGPSLAAIADKLGVGDYLYLSRGESRDKNSKGRQYILANALEAIIGAIYLDRGLISAKKFILKNIVNNLDNILANKLYIDSKSYFQEMAQEKLAVTPTYKIISSSGPDHAKIFVVGVYLDKELVATGQGANKQEAQTEAAKNALQKKGWQIK